MKSLAVEVPCEGGELVRRCLKEAGVLRTDLRVRHDGRVVQFPVAKPPTGVLPAGRLSEADFVPLRGPKPKEYRDLLQWPEPQKRLLPRAFDVVGDIVLIRIPPEFSSEAGRIGRALLEFVPGARLVGWDRGVHGEFRQREIVPIAGDGAFRTLHRENGLILEVDLTEAYFSPRLSREHARVSAAIAEPERVLDLCCGVGPFTMAIADGGKAREVEAVDSNPAAIQLLELNRARITTRTVIRSAVASLESFLPSAKPGERAILNLPREGIKYLPQVARLLKPGGWLHYYEVSDRSAWERRPAELCELLGYATDRAWTVRYQHVVHPYSPIQDLVAYDLEQSGGTGAR